ncbi:hypothetical protein FQR65_LT02418 [Abscondita terminalis]|nr:hypothetical protein FQR65_LT02418 [Abscondita terminalis]
MNLFLLICISLCLSVNGNVYLRFITMYLKKQTIDMMDAVGVETECAKQMQLLQSNLNGNKEWSMYMLDATGKLESGVLEGNIMMMGNYEECLKINESVNGSSIKGQFCVTFITPTPNTLQCVKNKTTKLPHAVFVNDFINYLEPTWGVCTMEACSSNQLQKLWDLIENRYQIKFHVTFKNESCSSKETNRNLTVPDYVAICVFSVLLAVLLTSTMYDIFIFQKKKDRSFNVWMSFSLYTNAKRLFSTKHTDEFNLTCIYGIRVILMMWIVLGHSYLTYLYLFAVNNIELLRWATEEKSMFIFGAISGVDSYFVISGCLIVYVTAIAREQGNSINLLVFYGHRFLRLTPALAAIVLISSGPLTYFGSGPYWYRIQAGFVDECVKTWWPTLTYIQNYYYNNTAGCVPHTWYLAVDTQLYLISPIIYVFLHKSPRIALSLIVLLIALSIASNIHTTIYYNMDRLASKTLYDYFYYIYRPTHLRAGPWLAGTILGHLLFTYKKRQVLIKKSYVVLLWTTSLVLMLSICYAYVVIVKNEFSLTLACLFNGFSRTAWGVCTCWIIFACTHGYGEVLQVGFIYFCHRDSFAFYPA